MCPWLLSKHWRFQGESMLRYVFAGEIKQQMSKQSFVPMDRQHWEPVRVVLTPLGQPAAKDGSAGTDR